MNDTLAIKRKAGANIRYGNTKSRRLFGRSSSIRSSAALSAMSNAPLGRCIKHGGPCDFVLHPYVQASLDIESCAGRNAKRGRAERAVENDFPAERLGQINAVWKSLVFHRDMFRPQAKDNRLVVCHARIRRKRQLQTVVGLEDPIIAARLRSAMDHVHGGRADKLGNEYRRRLVVKLKRPSDLFDVNAPHQ